MPEGDRCTWIPSGLVAGSLIQILQVYYIRRMKYSYIAFEGKKRSAILPPESCFPHAKMNHLQAHVDWIRLVERFVIQLPTASAAGGALQRPDDADLWGQRLRARQGDGDGSDTLKFTANFIQTSLEQSVYDEDHKEIWMFTIANRVLTSDYPSSKAGTGSEILRDLYTFVCKD